MKLKPKKIPFYLLIFLLTIGASVTLGFLSFGGTLVLGPLAIMLPIAFGTFALSVAYDAEIYFKNIKGAFTKLFKSHYLHDQLTKEFLLEKLLVRDEQGKTAINKNLLESTNCPTLLHDYLIQLQLWGVYHDKHLSKKDREGRAAQKKAKKDLRKMERCFAALLFQETGGRLLTPEEIQLRNWMMENGQKEYKARLNKRSWLFNGTKIFSIIAGIFMGISTTYLLMDVFTVVAASAALPFLAAFPPAALPLLIVPLAILAGAAYAFLTYNAVTDMINNDTIRKRLKGIYNSFRDDIRHHKFPFRSLIMGAAATLLVALAITLTVFTAGTWWTIAQKAQPVFDWMNKIPPFVMGIVNPLVEGTAAIFFNVENVDKPLSELDKELEKGNFIQRIGKALDKKYEDFVKLKKEEHWLQIINPFRVFLTIVLLPLRFILFLGHIASISAIADRPPGVNPILAAPVGGISEFVEEMDYFLPHGDHHHDHEHHDHEHHHHEHHHHEHHDQEHHHHEHHHHAKDLLEERLGAQHSHSHDSDIPTLILKSILTIIPIYPLAALWDWGVSQFNTDKEVLTWEKAWYKQWGHPITKVELNSNMQKTSESWQRLGIILDIDKHIEKELADTTLDPDLAANKAKNLCKFQKEIITAQSTEAVKQAVMHEKENSVYKENRNPFRLFDSPTKTQKLVEGFSELLSAPAA